MALFVGRQPILDDREETYGYELLFREGTENTFTGQDGDAASLSVINTGFFRIGLQKLTGGRMAFINFTRRLLLEDFGTVLPRDKVIIEILEDIEPDREIVAACRSLKEKGYTLALDDFEYTPKYDPLIEIIDLIKVDLSVSDVRERERMAKRFLHRNIRLLAERVETRNDFTETRDLGYTLFQGYFFSKPVVMKTMELPESKATHLRLLHEVNRKDLDMQKAENIIKGDPTLMMKLFRFINSAAFATRYEIQNIRQALSLLGQRNLQKWASLLVLAASAEDKPPELVKQMIVRARFCELVAEPAGFANDDQELFLTGMFSMLDAVLDQPMGDLLKDMPLSDTVKEALMGKTNHMRNILDKAVSLETGDWARFNELAEASNTSAEAIMEIQEEAIEWAEHIVTG